MRLDRILATPKYFAYVSIFISILCLIIKYNAYLVTGSVAIYSDAIESVINIVTSVIALATIIISNKPADEDHHYGHQKAEYISAVIEGLMIVVSAIAIAYEVYEFIFDPHDFELPPEGIAAIALATVLNGVWSRVLILRGRKLQSPALVADGSHLYSDMITSLGVVIGLLLVKITGIKIIDPIIAIVVACHILYHGSKVIQLSVNGLMDAAPSDREIKAISKIIQNSSKGAESFNSLRIRKAGRTIFIQFNLIMADDLTVLESHRICDSIEQALGEHYQDSMISIHVEPASIVS